jgi:DNA-binding transcriptional MerR regulator
VSLRTLRYYDKVGLLSPTTHTESGYRLYADEDLGKLQQILSLKFLGLSLDEIRFCLTRGPSQLEAMLAQQRQMMLVKRNQLDAIVKAIEETEALIQHGRHDWDSIARVIQVIQMEQNTEWVKKYFTDEQMKTMQNLSESSYSEEAREKLAQRGAWTEEDQKRASEQWAYVGSEAKRLAEAGADPAGEEAQALAKFKSDLLSQFTMGDAQVEAGLGKFWESFKAMPQMQRPFDASPFSGGEAGDALLNKAMEIYREKQS